MAEAPEISDDELIARIRESDSTNAYAELWSRHVDAAMAVALLFCGRSEAEDLVSEAFMRILAALREDKGPQKCFRAYLLQTTRNLAADHSCARRRTVLTGDISHFDRLVQHEDTPIDSSQLSQVAQAYHQLPTHWRRVLWYTAVEGLKPADIARILGVTAASVASLSYRARAALRRQYLEAEQEIENLPGMEAPGVEIDRTIVSAAMARAGSSSHEPPQAQVLA